MNKLKITTDVIIVGGGPAGASAAISLLLYSDLKVCVIEKSDLDTVKVGEHVSKSILDLTDYLKFDRQTITEKFAIPAYSSTSYWGSEFPSRNDSILTYESESFQLDRNLFDLNLLKKVADLGGTVLPRTSCESFKQMPNSEWIIEAKHIKRGNINIEAKYLIDATGRKSNVCRHLGIKSKKIDKLIGVGTFLDAGNLKNNEHHQIIESSECGWWYTSLLPNNTLSVTLFTDADIVSQMKLNETSRWNEALSKTKHISYKLSGMTSNSGKLFVRDASSKINNCSDQSNFIAIGDAAISFDPISSMGIGFAMTSGCHAARLVTEQLMCNDCGSTLQFQDDLESHFNYYLKTRKKYYQQEQRWSKASFWARRN